MASNFTLADCYVRRYDQPCWDCAKACGGCSWSAKLEPVPGWIAAERYIPYNSRTKTTTYKIMYCPEFEAEAPRDETCD